MAKQLGCAAVALSMLSLAACTPVGRAVGDTQDTMPEVAHDSTHKSDIEIGVVGSEDSSADTLVMDALADAEMKSYYASLDAVDDADATAQQAVDDFVARAVDLVMISGINVTGDNREGWDAALDNARQAGIPVVLLNPVNPPDNELYYAASLTVNDRAMDATPIDEALVTIQHDEPHERTIMVTTLH